MTKKLILKIGPGLILLPWLIINVDAQNCKDQKNAFELKVYRQRERETEFTELKPGYKNWIRRSDLLQIKMSAVKDACSPSIAEYVILVSPPDPKLSQLNWNTHPRFATVNAVNEAEYKISPYTVQFKGAVRVYVYPVNRKTKLPRAKSKQIALHAELIPPETLSETEVIKAHHEAFEVKMNAKNQNAESKDEAGLSITWSCNLISGDDGGGFCTPEGMKEFKGKFTVVFKEGVHSGGNKYKLGANVSLTDDPSVYREPVIIVIIKLENVPGTLAIEVTQNGKKLSNIDDFFTLSSSMRITFTGVCIKGGNKDYSLFTDCLQPADHNQQLGFEWKFKDIGDLRVLNDVESYVVKSKMSGLTQSELNAGARSLKPGTEFLVEFIIKSPPNSNTVKNSAIKQIATLKEASAITGCDITPQKGVAGDTGFRIKDCLYTPGTLQFEIYSVVGDEKNLLAKTNTIETETFVLPAGARVLLKIIDSKTGSTENKEFNVEVTKAVDPNKPKDELIEDIKNKIDEAGEVAKLDPNTALQILGAVEDEYSKLKNVSLEEVDKKMLDIMEKIDVKDASTAQQSANILENIASRYNKSDPDIAAKTADLCQHAGQVMLEDAKNMKSPEIMKEQLTGALKSLSGCSQVGLKPNPESVAPDAINVSMPVTEAPLMPPKGPKENYPDYLDDEASSEKIAQFDKAAKMMETMCFINSKMLIYTMATDEPPVVNRQGSMVVVSAKMSCHKAVSKYVASPEALIKVSKTCQVKNASVVSVMMCTTNKNPYWYIDNIPLLTSVIYLNVTGTQNTTEMNLLGEDYFSLKFILNKTAPSTLQVHEAALPLKRFSELSEDEFYNDISTHRIFVKRNRGFTVEFVNLTENDKYDINLLNFEKPSYDLFMRKRKLVDFKNSMITVSTINSYDSFWFLSVLPGKLDNNNFIENLQTDRNYRFRVYSSGCYAWNEIVKFWEPSCKSKETTSINITCLCQSGSVFTGYRSPNVVTFEQELKHEFNLKLSFCWIVFLSTLITFTIFTWLLFFTSFEEDDKLLDKVFFVADVPSFYEYAYLIHISTGKQKNAGTTSNVTVKIRGTEGDSLEHVLNYPDPDLIMMQRKTEFWFVLASHKSVGDVTELEVWFDSLGKNTNWYCSKIEIVDLQTTATWLFDLEKWFDVTQEGHHKFKVTPAKPNLDTKAKKGTKSARIINAIKDFRGKLENEANLWQLRAKDPLLSRNKRVVLTFTSIFSMYVIIMFIYSVPQFDESDTIDPNNFGFNLKLVWTPPIGSSIAFLVTSPFVYLFKKRTLSSSIRGKSKQKLFYYMQWTLLLLIFMFAVTALIICGFWIPRATSLLWLISSALAILVNWLVLQNLSRLVYIYYIKLHIQVQSLAERAKRIIRYVELQRVWIYKRFGALGLRPYLRHLYFELDYVALKDRVKWEQTKLKIKEILDDLVMISLYVILLYIILMLDRESQEIYNHKEVTKLVEVKKVGRWPFKVTTLKSMENYIVEKILPSVQSITWYGKFIQENPGMTKDFSNKYLGIIRIRQHRIQEIPCILPEMAMYWTRNRTCRPNFGQFIDRGTYSRGWQPAEFTNATSRMSGVWNYSDSKLTGAPAYFGDYGYYPGGGYVATLGRNLKNSLINMNYLQKHKWFDLRTRAVFVEFLTYNPHVNLFNAVSVLFEHNSAGNIVSHFEVTTRKFLLIDKHKLFNFEVVSVLFCAAISFLMIRVLYKVFKKRARYFYDFWSTFDIIIIVLTGVSVYFFMARYKMIKVYLDQVSKAKNNEFVNYFHLFDSDNVLTALTASLVFIATLRLWKLLRFMIIVKIAEKTLTLCWKSVLVCMTYQMVYMVAFSVIYILFIASSAKDFRDFPTAFTSLLLLSMNLFNNFNVKQFDRHPLGVPLYIIFMLFSLLFMTVYVAIINIYYADAKDIFAEEESSVNRFVREKWNYYRSLARVKKKRLRGGTDVDPEDELVIKPRAGERFEDAIAVAKNKIDAMAFISMCVLRNRERNKIITEDDFKLMSKTIKALYGRSSKNDIFFTTGDSHHIEFVADRRLCQIAELCEKVVRTSRNDIRVSRKIDKTVIQNRSDRIDALINNITIMSSILNNIQLKVK